MKYHVEGFCNYQFNYRNRQLYISCCCSLTHFSFVTLPKQIPLSLSHQPNTSHQNHKRNMNTATASPPSALRIVEYDQADHVVAVYTPSTRSSPRVIDSGRTTATAHVSTSTSASTARRGHSGSEKQAGGNGDDGETSVTFQIEVCVLYRHCNGRCNLQHHCLQLLLLVLLVHSCLHALRSLQSLPSLITFQKMHKHHNYAKTFRDAFLPAGYPQSVTSDYTE